jgi:hypothetical protein
MPIIRRPVRPHIEAGRRLLVGCEGKSESHYLDEIRQQKRLSTHRMVILDCPCTDPLGIVNLVLQEREVFRKEKRWTDSDQAWAVFDGDEHRDAVPLNWNNAIQLAQARGVNLAISNPSIELWFLLHFQDQTGHIHRDKAKALLKKHIRDYEKGCTLYSNTLGPLTQLAVERCRNLAAAADRDKFSPYSNPSSGVSDLVVLMLEWS